MTGLDADRLHHRPGVRRRARSTARWYSRRAGGMQATDIFFKVPDTSPAPIVAAQAGAARPGPPTRSPTCCRATRSSDSPASPSIPANVKGQFQGQLTIDLGDGQDGAARRTRNFTSWGRCPTSSSTNTSATSASSRARSTSPPIPAALKITGQGLVNGVPAKVELAKGRRPTTARSTDELTLDDAARAKLGPERRTADDRRRWRCA